MDLEKAYLAIVDCWQLKVVISAVITIGTFLFGNVGVEFIALWVLVILDLFSRWACITKQHMETTGNKFGWWAGFCNAWETGVLNSYEMRCKFLPKVAMYLVILIAAHMLSIIIPKKVILGIDWTTLPDVMVTIYLGITEFMSINENFVTMGHSFLSPLSLFFRKKRDDMVGYIDKERNNKNGSNSN